MIVIISSAVTIIFHQYVHFMSFDTAYQASHRQDRAVHFSDPDSRVDD